MQSLIRRGLACLVTLCWLLQPAIAPVSAALAESRSASAGPCTALSAPVYRVANARWHSNMLTPSWSYVQSLTQTDGFTGYSGAPIAASTSAATGLVEIHRLFRSTDKNQVFMPRGASFDAAIRRWSYRDVGVAFYALASASGCGVPAYRYISPLGASLQVFSSADRTTLTSRGYRYAGIDFYAASGAGNPSTVDPTFSIAVMPDTQQETLQSTDPRFSNRTKWIVAQRTAKDIRFVLHTGDVVNWGWLVPAQYTVAKAAMAPIEQAGVPYALTIGNHDTRAVGWNGVAGSRGYGGTAYVGNPECVERLGTAACNTNLLVRHTEEFNATFTASRYTAVGGAFEAGKVDNIWSTFTAGGDKWLVLTLELWPRTAVVTWAKAVVAAHADYHVIVQTHSYLNADGTISTSNGGYGANSPKYLFDNLIKVYPNIKMVFSGHTGQATYRTDLGTHGNKIVSFLQAFHSNTTNPVRIVNVDSRTGAISSQIYAPYTNEHWSQYDMSMSGMRF